MNWKHEAPRPRSEAHRVARAEDYLTQRGRGSTRGTGDLTADLRGFWVDVMGAHPISQERATGAYVCRCGMVAEYCPAHRAAIRNHLQSPDEIPWQPLPEDLPPH